MIHTSLPGVLQIRVGWDHCSFYSDRKLASGSDKFRPSSGLVSILQFSIYNKVDIITFIT